MRWHNALGRIAAGEASGAANTRRRSSPSTAGTRTSAFYPYLLGYIAFFAKDYKGAVDELLKGDQNDPFVLGLIAQSTRLGDRAKAEGVLTRRSWRPRTASIRHLPAAARAFLR